MDRQEVKIRLAIPTIDLLECRKFKGGYHEDSNYDTDNYSPEDENYGIDGGKIDQSIIVEDSGGGYDREDGFERDDNWDDNQDDYDQYEDDELEIEEDERGDTPLIVKVDDGKCSIGTFAAAIQIVYGEIASKAILMAETAMKDAGIDLTVQPNTNTINFAWGQYSDALANYFNITDFKSLPSSSRFETIEEFFNAGGCGILMDETHMVCAVDYENGIFTYYDSTTGQYDTGYVGEFKELILLERK